MGYKNKEKQKAYLKEYRQRNKKRIKKLNKAWFDKHPDYEKNRWKKDKEKRAASNKKWRSKNTEKLKEYHKRYDKEYYKKNKDIKLAKTKEYNKKSEVKIKRNKKHNQRRKTDLLFKLKLNLRSRLKSFVKVKGMVQTKRTMDLIGCTPKQLRAHIEKQFKPGMSWDNYGFKTWHIDHIKPLDLAKSMQEIIDGKFMHYTNLQPMWADENHSKGNKYEK